MTTPIDRFRDALLRYGCNVKGSSSTCPSHDDRSPSLSFSEAADGRVIYHCHAGCDFRDIADDIGIDLADLFPEREQSPFGDIIATYPYYDADGELLYQVCRLQPKDFRARRPDGAGGWIWNTQGVDRVIYNLPGVIQEAADGGHIWVVEGEKDADRLRAEEEVATCNVFGAGKWESAYARHFDGASSVTIIADNDETGEDHAADVAASLEGIVPLVQIVNCTRGKDISEHFANGGKLADLTNGGPDWPEPQPLRESFNGERPKFPTHTLPKWMADAVDDVARTLQVDTSATGPVALGALASLTCGRLNVRIKNRHEEPCNLFIGIAAMPSYGKSPILKALASNAINDVTNQLHESHRSRAAKYADALGDAEAAGDVLEIEEITDKIGPVPALTAEDATPEALVAEIAKQKRGIALISGEGGPLEGVDRYRSSNEAPKLSVYLKGFSGEGADVRRISRGAEYVRPEHMNISALIMAQPDLLEQTFTDPAFRGRGFSQRWLIAYPPDVSGYRDMLADHEADVEVMSRYDDRATRIGLSYLAHGQQPLTATMNPAARRRYAEFRQWAEDQRRPGGALRNEAGIPNGWKIDSFCARLAALLMVADASEDPETRGDFRPDEVTVAHVERAIELVEFFMFYELSIVDLLRDTGPVSDTERLAKALTEAVATGKHRAGIPIPYGTLRRSVGMLREVTAAEARPMMETLEAAGWVQIIDPVERGGRYRYEVAISPLSV